MQEMLLSGSIRMSLVSRAGLCRFTVSSSARSFRFVLLYSYFAGREVADNAGSIIHTFVVAMHDLSQRCGWREM